MQFYGFIGLSLGISFLATGCLAPKGKDELVARDEFGFDAEGYDIEGFKNGFDRRKRTRSGCDKDGKDSYGLKCSDLQKFRDKDVDFDKYQALVDKVDKATGDLRDAHGERDGFEKERDDLADEKVSWEKEREDFEEDLDDLKDELQDEKQKHIDDIADRDKQIEALTEQNRLNALSINGLLNDKALLDQRVNQLNDDVRDRELRLNALGQEKDDASRERDQQRQKAEALALEKRQFEDDNRELTSQLQKAKAERDRVVDDKRLSDETSENRRREIETLTKSNGDLIKRNGRLENEAREKQEAWAKAEQQFTKELQALEEEKLQLTKAQHQATETAKTLHETIAAREGDVRDAREELRQAQLKAVEELDTIKSQFERSLKEKDTALADASVNFDREKDRLTREFERATAQLEAAEKDFQEKTANFLEETKRLTQENQQKVRELLALQETTAEHEKELRVTEEELKLAQASSVKQQQELRNALEATAQKEEELRLARERFAETLSKEVEALKLAKLDFAAQFQKLEEEHRRERATIAIEEAEKHQKAFASVDEHLREVSGQKDELEIQLAEMKKQNAALNEQQAQDLIDTEGRKRIAEDNLALQAEIASKTEALQQSQRESVTSTRVIDESIERAQSVLDNKLLASLVLKDDSEDFKLTKDTLPDLIDSLAQWALTKAKELQPQETNAADLKPKFDPFASPTKPKSTVVRTFKMPKSPGKTGLNFFEGDSPMSDKKKPGSGLKNVPVSPSKQKGFDPFAIDEDGDDKENNLSSANRPTVPPQQKMPQLGSGTIDFFADENAY